MRINSACGGQNVWTSLSLRTKLAFLSAVSFHSSKSSRSEPATAIGSLDSWLLAQIFEFATD